MKARLLVCAAVVGVLLVGTFDGARADDKQEKPDAVLSISATALAAGAGYSWGTGKLTYQGKEYDVTIDGLTVGTVGMTSIDAVGEVYYLKKLEDFDGNYTAAAAAGTIGGGTGALAMRNPHGVMVAMTATTRGVALTLGVSGVKLALKK
jgi:hypothetical protein